MARIVVTLEKGCDRASVVADLHKFGEVEQFGAIPLMLISVAPESALAPIRAIPGVKRAVVETDNDFELQSDHLFAPMQPENTGQMPLVIHGQRPGERLWSSFYDLLIEGKAITYRYDPTAGGAGDGSGVNIYVVDSGVQETHEEFTGKFGSRLYNAQGSDPFGFHGTACASVAMGANLGVAPGATVYDSRCFPTEGGVSSSVLVNGMNAALTHFNANSQPGVMSCSFGGQGSTDSYDTVIDACVDAGLVVVASSGNNGLDLNNTGGSDNYWPAENVDALTVGGLTSDLHLHGGANYYGTCDLYAMYQQWTTADVGPDNSYRTAGRVRGTSFSCPLVAGMVARALTGTTKMTSRAEFDAFRAQFLADYTVEDITNFSGAIEAGLKRLWVPGVSRHEVADYAPPAFGIAENVPLEVDFASTSLVLGGTSSGIAVRHARTHVILEG